MSAPLDYRPLRAEDIDQVSRLHVQAFPGFFLSRLGPAFLAEFYRGYLTHPDAISVVAAEPDGTVRGAVVGTTRPVAFFSSLLRRRWYRFAWAAAATCLREPSAIPRVLRAVRFRGDAASPQDGAVLSSVFVDPSGQSRGVGAQLVSRWLAAAGAAGASRAFLTTDRDDNEATTGFYRRLGWVARDEYLTPEGRAMLRYVIDIPPGSSMRGQP